MIARSFFVAILFLTACGQMKSTPESNTVSVIQDSATDTIATNDLKSISKANANSGSNCDVLLHSLVNSSSFNPEVKKFKFNVSVDELTDGVATLKVTMRNTERNEDLAIGWLKMNAKKNQLFDVTSDPDNPEELKYDSILFKKAIRHCAF